MTPGGTQVLRGPALELTDLNVVYGRQGDQGSSPSRSAPGDQGGRPPRSAAVHAVRRACLTVEAGQVVALIGETGSGKSSLALAAAGLLPRSAAITGQITIAGRDVSAMDRAGFRRVRASLLGCIAQDAMAALNPVVPVGRQIGELFTQHASMNSRQAAEAAVAALAQVEIRQPAAVARLFPHQLSGGMRQRVMIAMAIALAPPLIVADEPTTALDVSTQAEILALIGELREGMRSGFLWITHDMGVVAELADWAAVMYAGRIVEQAPVEQIFDTPAHPYTQGLLQTRRDLRAGAPGTPLFQIAGAPPAPGEEPTGCPFRPRCPRATQVCADTDPALEPVSAGHLAACHHPAIADAPADTPSGAHAASGPGGEGERR